MCYAGGLETLRWKAFPAEMYAQICLFSDVFVPLDKINGTSAMKRKVCFSHFSFALRSVCIIFR